MPRVTDFNRVHLPEDKLLYLEAHPAYREGKMGPQGKYLFASKFRFVCQRCGAEGIGHKTMDIARGEALAHINKCPARQPEG